MSKHQQQRKYHDKRWMTLLRNDLKVSHFRNVHAWAGARARKKSWRSYQMVLIFLKRFPPKRSSICFSNGKFFPSGQFPSRVSPMQSQSSFAIGAFKSDWRFKKLVSKVAVAAAAPSSNFPTFPPSKDFNSEKNKRNSTAFPPSGRHATSTIVVIILCSSGNLINNLTSWRLSWDEESRSLALAARSSTIP